MKNYRISLLGLLSATFFIGMFVGAYHFNEHSVAQQSGNSGEGGIILILYTLPWIALFPSSVAAGSFRIYAIFISVSFNAVLIYFLMGGALAFFHKKKL